MTKALRFTAAELNSAARIVREQGVLVKLERDGSILVFPETHRPAMVDMTTDEALDRELAAFKAKHGHD